jgi:hypothetical protein
MKFENWISEIKQAQVNLNSVIRKMPKDEGLKLKIDIKNGFLDQEISPGLGGLGELSDGLEIDQVYISVEKKLL